MHINSLIEMEIMMMLMDGWHYVFQNTMYLLVNSSLAFTVGSHGTNMSAFNFNCLLLIIQVEAHLLFQEGERRNNKSKR